MNTFQKVNNRKPQSRNTAYQQKHERKFGKIFKFILNLLKEI